MANRNLFASVAGRLLPRATAKNEAGGRAYNFTAEHALAQYAATGCLNGTYYASEQDQLETVVRLAAGVDHHFIARTALWCRREGYMKDMPALLCALLSACDGALCERIFPRVIDNGRMLRNFVQIIRSGCVGRKSLGTRLRRMVRTWLESHSAEELFRVSVGNDPSLGDIIKMTHPKPADCEREALYGYLIGREHDASLLPRLVREFEAYKSGESNDVPEVPFEMLTALPLGTKEWAGIARMASWQMTRMNLNTFARHGVFEVPGMAACIARRLSDPAKVKAARVFPYQLLMAYRAAGEGVPECVCEALQDAMELATANVPALEGRVYVLPDISGSMQSPVTGYRPGATSAVRCVDVAALVAACVLRKNRQAQVIPFHDQAVAGVRLDPRDSVMTNANLLAGLPSGGTNCSAPLRYLNERSARGSLIIFISDNQSWLDSCYHPFASATMAEWLKFRARNPQAKLVCIDIQPYGTTQASERPDILNIGGFSEQVFRLVAKFAEGRLGDGHWVEEINAIEL